MNTEFDKSSKAEFETQIRINNKHLDSLAKLLTVCFIDDPLTKLQINDIFNPEDFLIKLFREQLEIYSKTRDVFILDESCKSLLIGCEKKRMRMLFELFLGIQASSKLKKQIDKSVFKTYANNLKSATKAIDLNWYKPLKIKNFYYINIIAVDKSEKGKGKFRALFSPIISYCNKIGIPAILETANPNNVPLFEHIGFKLVKSIENKQTGISQYCFIKNPDLQP